MPRVARTSLETSFFHIVVQGINREYIFKNNEYIEKYYSLLVKYKEKFNIKILAYCIMNNHAHILIYTKNINEMSKYMKSINTSYGNYYNKKENRVGFVFRNRYISQPIYTQEYLLGCILYIHMNPVKANIVKQQSEYMYSSYNDYINKNGIINEDVIKMVFGSIKGYIEQFLSIKIEEDNKFVECQRELVDEEKILYEYCKNKNLTIYEIKEEEEFLIDLIEYLVLGNGVTRTKVAEMLNINRLRIMRLLKKRE